MLKPTPAQWLSSQDPWFQFALIAITLVFALPACLAYGSLLRDLLRLRGLDRRLRTLAEEHWHSATPSEREREQLQTLREDCGALFDESNAAAQFDQFHSRWLNAAESLGTYSAPVRFVDVLSSLPLLRDQPRAATARRLPLLVLLTGLAFAAGFATLAPGVETALSIALATAALAGCGAAGSLAARFAYEARGASINATLERLYPYVSPGEAVAELAEQQTETAAAMKESIRTAGLQIAKLANQVEVLRMATEVRDAKEDEQREEHRAVMRDLRKSIEDAAGVSDSLRESTTALPAVVAELERLRRAAEAMPWEQSPQDATTALSTREPSSALSSARRPSLVRRAWRAIGGRPTTGDVPSSQTTEHLPAAPTPRESQSATKATPAAFRGSLSRFSARAGEPEEATSAEESTVSEEPARRERSVAVPTPPPVRTATADRLAGTVRRSESPMWRPKESKPAPQKSPADGS